MEELFPKFAKQHGEMVSPIPYNFENALYFQFVVGADQGALQNLCDEWFNKPSNFNVVVEPLAPFVLLAFAWYPKAYPATQDPELFGAIQYKEVVLTMMVKTQETPCGNGKETYSFVPFLFLNRPRAIAAGREIFCLPKVYGEVEMPTSLDNLSQNRIFSTSTVALPQFDPVFQATNRELFRIEASPDFEALTYSDDSSENGQSNWDKMDSYVYSKLQDADGMNMETARNLSRGMQMKFINLRQWRDFINPQRAVNSSVFEYHAREMVFNQVGPLLGDFTMTYPDDCAMFPIREALGLSPNISLALWYRWNFQFVLGNDLWSAKSGLNFPRPNASVFTGLT